MDDTTQESLLPTAIGAASACPVDHTAWSRHKTAAISDATVTDSKPAIERTADGVWHIYGFQEARTILRSDTTKQAGFNAEQIEQVAWFLKPAILYLEGQTHHQQRKQTARFFTPKAVDSNYRQLMEHLAEELLANLQPGKQTDLSELSFKLAVGVAGRIIGLTDSRDARMNKRIDAFFDNHTPIGLSRWHPKRLLVPFIAASTQWSFYRKDVRPAIRKRRLQPQDDLISFMLSQHARDRDIQIECVTYAAAGMATTREFITVASWHMLEHPSLRARYLAAPEEERYCILEEILRIEPVAGHLYRWATEDFQIESNGTTFAIARGDVIHLHIYSINMDAHIITEHPQAICPDRELHAERVSNSLMSFGDGHHRCAGSYVAIQESDIFLRRLLAFDNLKLLGQPELIWNDVTSGYQIRNFLVTLG